MFIKINVGLIFPFIPFDVYESVWEKNNYNLGKVIFINNLKLFNDFLSPALPIWLYC